MHIGLFCPPDGPGPVGRGSPGLSADPDQNGCTGHRATRGDGIACAIYGFASRWAFAGPAVSTGSTVLDRGIVLSISSTCRGWRLRPFLGCANAVATAAPLCAALNAKRVCSPATAKPCDRPDDLPPV